MTKRVVIDLDKLREEPGGGIPCEYLYHPDNDGVATLRELAAFEVFCRRCELACCVEACGRDALERNDDGVLMRHNLRCVGCMSCSRACPFGTILEQALRWHHGSCDFCEPRGAATPGCVEGCSTGALEHREVSPGEEGVFLVGARMAVKATKWVKTEAPKGAGGK